MYELSAIFFALLFICMFVGLILYWGRNKDRMENSETDIEIRLLDIERALIDKIAARKGFNINRDQREKLRNRIYEDVQEEYNNPKEGEK